MRPDEGAISPAAMLSKVDLPQPVGPTMATNSPAETAGGMTRVRQHGWRGSVPTAIHQGALLDPRHHGAQLGADLLDRMRSHLGAHGLERGLVDAVLQHPVLDELAGLD